MQKCVYVPHFLQIVFAPGLPRLNRSELAEHAPGLTRLSETGTELQFELCCGDDPAGVKPTTFRAGRDFAIPRMVSLPLLFLALCRFHMAEHSSTQKQEWLREKRVSSMWNNGSSSVDHEQTDLSSGCQLASGVPN